MPVNKSTFMRYVALVLATAFLLFGVRYTALYLFSSHIDWNIAIGVIAIALPLAIQFLASLLKRQKENQFKIEQVQDALDSLPVMQRDIEKIYQVVATITVLEERLDCVENENRRQERLMARMDAVLETIIQQEQLHAKVDRLGDVLQKLQARFPEKAD